jgi:hypothetical protein
MRIGLSFSRCLADIIRGNVAFDDVLVIIARTDFNPHNDEQWATIWDGYHGGHFLSMPEWFDFEEEDNAKFQDLAKRLYDTGKLHQPRQFGAHPRRLPYYWLEANVVPEDLERNPAAKIAWEKYQTLLGLS